ncbi:MAG: alpha-mannosyltransferase [Hyphomicrobiales bacterium]|nr:MAG: alpha-mannosyltransferase [Hyphomicrobiales bacterium]
MFDGKPKKLLIVSDAWEPQTNGVVRSLGQMVLQAPAFGFTATVIGPGEFKTLPCPSYPEIRLTASLFKTVQARLEATQPDYVHIATEGPLGWAARKWCIKNARTFTTSYHTRFPEYVSARIKVPESWIYRGMRWFHKASAACLVPTPTIVGILEQRGFQRLKIWTRGVNLEQFGIAPDAREINTNRPKLLYVGRLAVEKNLDAFLSLNIAGEKIVVGDGPQRGELQARYPDVYFIGKLVGAELAKAYATSDVFVFPSKTDTFGIVMLEALASGLPIAALPVAGPLDVVGPYLERGGVNGQQVACLSHNLKDAIEGCLGLSREHCRQFASAHSWHASAKQFYGHIRAANDDVVSHMKGPLLTTSQALDLSRLPQQ